MEMGVASFRFSAAATVTLAALCLAVAVARADTPDYEQPPIRYSTTQPYDPASRLKAQLDRGLSLAHDGERGYLAAILRELKIPQSSQTLVFSKTSFQHARISPSRP